MEGRRQRGRLAQSWLTGSLPRRGDSSSRLGSGEKASESDELCDDNSDEEEDVDSGAHDDGRSLSFQCHESSDF